MNQDLIERYIYAVTKRLPRKQREDVAQELRGLIDDLLTERCGTLTPGERDVRVVLTELGTPQELYEKYDENGQTCLIGQPHYSTYAVVVKIVLACTALGMTIACGVLQMVEPRVWYGAVARWLCMLWQSLVYAYAVVTALFAVFYRKGVRLGEPFNFDDLPPVPKKSQQISLWEPLVGMALCVVFGVVFLAAPAVLGVVRGDSGEWIPIFNVAGIRAHWYILALFMALGIAGESVKLMERRYSRKVMWVTVGTNLISGVLAVWWLSGDQLYNPAFVARLHGMFSDEAPVLGTVMGNFHIIFLGVILFALVLDTAETIFKTLRK